MGDGKDCTCGSGAHPRKCSKHPYAYRLHVAELNLFWQLSGALEASGNCESTKEAEEYAEELIKEFEEAVLEKAKFLHNKEIL